MIKWFLNELVYSEEELWKRRARDFCMKVWLQLHLLDTYSECDRLLRSVLMWALNQRPSFHISSCWPDCWENWYKDLPRSSSKGQNYSVNKGEWSAAFMKMHIMIFYSLCIKSAKSKNYSPPSVFLCVICTFPDFLFFFHQFYSYSSSLFLCLHFPGREGCMSFRGTSISFG